MLLVISKFRITLKRQFGNQAGVSIIEVLVAGGIMAIIFAATASLIASQQKEGRALAEKMASLDLERLLINSLSNGTICSAELASNVFNSTGPYKIDTSNLATQVINLSSLHASKLASAPTLISVGQTASSLSYSLKIDTIRFQNFVSAGLPDLYLTDLEVSLKGGVRSFKPAPMQLPVGLVLVE